MSPDLIAGRYRVVRAIGHGGMGTVWLCQDEVLGREVAVKQIGVLPGESAPDAARALREARSSAALNHRNVVSIFDVADDDSGHAWLVMEYVPSRTLGELVREEGPLDPHRAAAIGAQVADGLAAAHAVGTIHRDVKPGNILVGDGDVTKLTDFGIARRLGDDQLTRTGLVTGTPSYFSPELARGEDPGPESDVYALGASLYLAVEGRAPYPEERNPIALLQRIASEEPRAAVRAGVLAEPLARMMDRDPRARWTVSDAAAALHRVADGGPAAEAGAAGEDRPTAVLSSGPAATPAATPATNQDTAPTPVPPPAADPRAHGSGRRRRALWLAASVVALLLVLGAGLGMMSDEEPPEAAAPSDAPSDAPASRPADRPTPSASSPSTPSSSAPASPSAPSARPTESGNPEQAVTEYFSLVPADTDAGWSRLAPSMQEEVGRSDYDRWWGSIDAVEVHSTEPVEDDQVQIELTYRFSDGSAARETQLLTLEQSGGRWLIADDQVLSSGSA